jgi:hypothetical protein
MTMSFMRRRSQRIIEMDKTNPTYLGRRHSAIGGQDIRN